MVVVADMEIFSKYKYGNWSHSYTIEVRLRGLEIEKSSCN
jgi:hypothetical protein